MLLTNYLLYKNFYPLKKVGIVLKNFMKGEKMEFNENTKLFQKYMERIRNGDTEAMNEMGLIFQNSKDNENAKKWLEKGLELIKKSSDYSDNLELQKSLKENLDYIKKAK